MPGGIMLIMKPHSPSECVGRKLKINRRNDWLRLVKTGFYKYLPLNLLLILDEPYIIARHISDTNAYEAGIKFC